MKKFFRIFLVGEPQVYYDVPVPDDFEFSQFVTDIINRGYLLTDFAFLPYAAIKHIGVFMMQDNKPVAFTRPTLVN